MEVIVQDDEDKLCTVCGFPCDLCICDKRTAAEKEAWFRSELDDFLLND